MTTSAAESTLLVPVHDAEESVAGLRRRLDPASAHGLPAHVTVLYPFGPVRVFSEEDGHTLATALASVRAFDFVLSSVAWFDERVLYLAPEDPAPFVALTTAVASLFPAYPPYRGAYDSVVPHMTVGGVPGRGACAGGHVPWPRFSPSSARRRRVVDGPRHRGAVGCQQAVRPGSGAEKRGPPLSVIFRLSL